MVLIFKKLLVILGMMSLIGGTFIAIMTYINIGFSDEFFSKWFSSLVFAMLVMMPLGGVFMYGANSLVRSISPNLDEILQNILIGILMALSMEAIMAVSTTINVVGYTSLDSFSTVWLKSYVTALPFTLVISPVLTIFIKPRLDAYLAT